MLVCARCELPMRITAGLTRHRDCTHWTPWQSAARAGAGAGAGAGAAARRGAAMDDDDAGGGDAASSAAASVAGSPHSGAFGIGGGGGDYAGDGEAAADALVSVQRMVVAHGRAHLSLRRLWHWRTCALVRATGFVPQTYVGVFRQRQEQFFRDLATSPMAAQEALFFAARSPAALAAAAAAAAAAAPPPLFSLAARNEDVREVMFGVQNRLGLTGPQTDVIVEDILKRFKIVGPDFRQPSRSAMAARLVEDDPLSRNIFNMPAVDLDAWLSPASLSFLNLMYPAATALAGSGVRVLPRAYARELSGAVQELFNNAEGFTLHAQNAGGLVSEYTEGNAFERAETVFNAHRGVVYTNDEGMQSTRSVAGFCLSIDGLTLVSIQSVSYLPVYLSSANVNHAERGRDKSAVVLMLVPSPAFCTHGRLQRKQLSDLKMQYYQAALAHLSLQFAVYHSGAGGGGGGVRATWALPCLGVNMPPVAGADADASGGAAAAAAAPPPLPHIFVPVVFSIVQDLLDSNKLASLKLGFSQGTRICKACMLPLSECGRALSPAQQEALAGHFARDLGRDHDIGVVAASERLLCSCEAVLADSDDDADGDADADADAGAGASGSGSDDDDDDDDVVGGAGSGSEYSDGGGTSGSGSEAAAATADDVPEAGGGSGGSDDGVGGGAGAGAGAGAGDRNRRWPPTVLSHPLSLAQHPLGIRLLPTPYGIGERLPVVYFELLHVWKALAARTLAGLYDIFAAESGAGLGATLAARAAALSSRLSACIERFSDGFKTWTVFHFGVSGLVCMQIRHYMHVIEQLGVIVGENGDLVADDARRHRVHEGLLLLREVWARQSAKVAYSVPDDARALARLDCALVTALGAAFAGVAYYTDTGAVRSAAGADPRRR
jgi:hypothetical protein